MTHLVPLKSAKLLFLTLFFIQSQLFAVSELRDKLRLPDNTLSEDIQGVDYDRITSPDGFSSLSDLASSQMTLRSSGPDGQTSIPAIDGGLSQHTRAAINGHVIRFSQMDSADLSLFPVELSTAVELYSGNLVPSGVDASGGVINFQLPSALLIHPSLAIALTSLFGVKLKTLLPLQEGNFESVAGLSLTFSGNRFDYINSAHTIQASDNLDYGKLSALYTVKWKQFSTSTFITFKNGGTGSYYAGKARQDDFLFSSSLKYQVQKLFFNLFYDFWNNHYTNSFSHTDDTHQNHHAGIGISTRFTFGQIRILSKNKLDAAWLISSKIGNHQDFSLTSILSPSLQFGFFSLSFPQNINLHSEGKFNWIPGASLLVHPKTWNIRYLANFGRLHRRPTMNDLYWPRDSFSSGNPDLHSENGWSHQSAIILTLFPFLFKINYRHNAYTEMILWSPDAFGIWSPKNTGRITSDIIRTSAIASGFLGLWWWQSSVEFSYNYTVNQNPSSIYFGKRVIYIPLYKTAIHFQVSYRKDFRLNITLNQNSERYTTEANTVWLPAYINLNISVEWQGFQVLARNLTDSVITENKGYPLPGRNLELGYTYQW